MLDIYTDGASLGNPGRIGVGYVFYREGTPVKKEGLFLGENTNNFAEYMAFIVALLEARAMGETRCRVYSDSQLLCEQINGRYRVKNSNIISVYALAKRVIALFDGVEVTYVAREENREADRLAKQAAQQMRSCT